MREERESETYLFIDANPLASIDSSNNHACTVDLFGLAAVLIDRIRTRQVRVVALEAASWLVDCIYSPGTNASTKLTVSVNHASLACEKVEAIVLKLEC